MMKTKHDSFLPKGAGCSHASITSPRHSAWRRKPEGRVVSCLEGTDALGSSGLTEFQSFLDYFLKSRETKVFILGDGPMVWHLLDSLSSDTEICAHPGNIGSFSSFLLSNLPPLPTLLRNKKVTSDLCIFLPPAIPCGFQIRFQSGGFKVKLRDELFVEGQCISGHLIGIKNTNQVPKEHNRDQIASFAFISPGYTKIMSKHHCCCAWSMWLVETILRHLL